MFSHTKHLLVFLLPFIFVNGCKDEESTAPERSKIPPAVTVKEKTRNSNMDKSPMDILYYPVDFPILKMSGKTDGNPVVRIIYSRPSKDGRRIFGNVVKYGTYWRLGANEGTEIEFFRDVVISGKTVSKGRYILYAIPYEKNGH